MRFLFLLLICSSAFGQEIQLDYHRAYKYRRDTLSGAGLQWHRHTLVVQKNDLLKRKLSTSTFTFAPFGDGDPYQQDSVVNRKRKFVTNRFDYYVFSKMMDHITANQNDKMIGIQPYYFLSKDFLQNHNDQQIGDSLDIIKSQLKRDKHDLYYSNVWGRFWVELDYEGVHYTLFKSERSPFWKVYINDSDEVSFRFLYPDWNLFIGQVYRMKGQNLNPQLRIISSEYDLGNEIKTPITPKRKRAKIQN